MRKNLVILGKRVGIVTLCFWWLRDKCDQIGWRLHRGHRLKKGGQIYPYLFEITYQEPENALQSPQRQF
jgi:hypothetical protein